MYPTTIRIAAATIAALLISATTPAEARAPKRTTIDVAAVPAYPVATERARYRAPSAKKQRRAARASRASAGRPTSAAMVRVQTAYGFPITVHPAYAGKFQRLFSLLKERGYVMPDRLVRVFKNGQGCFARGGHVPGSNHYIGAACDIQWGWNQAPSFMYRAGDLIRQAGLYDGCSFRDCGHVEAVRGTYNRAPDLYTSVAKFREAQAANYLP